MSFNSEASILYVRCPRFVFWALQTLHDRNCWEEIAITGKLSRQVDRVLRNHRVSVAVRDKINFLLVEQNI